MLVGRRVGVLVGRIVAVGVSVGRLVGRGVEVTGWNGVGVWVASGLGVTNKYETAPETAAGTLASPMGILHAVKARMSTIKTKDFINFGNILID